MFLGLDVGTSGVKAVLEDEAGALVATASRPLTLSHPKPLWSEQNPDDWVAASVGAVDDLARLHPRETASVSGIGLSGHEQPFIIAGSNVVLREGMAFSIEPGIYLPGKWGMRIEDIVRMTADGVEPLNRTRRTLGGNNG